MSDNIKETLGEIQTAFTELKSTNEAKLAEMATKGSVDTLLDTKLASINDTISKLEKKIGLPMVSTDNVADEYAAEFKAWVRKGTEIKAINTASPGADGGVAMPKLVEAGLYTALRTSSVIRSLSTVVSITSNDYRVLFNNGGAGAGWVGETDARGATASPTLAEITVPMGEVYANIPASQRAIDDLSFDVEGLIRDEATYQIGAIQDAAYVRGTGVNQPKGILTSAASMTQINTGNATKIVSGDSVISMTQAMSAPYRAGAAFITQAAGVGAVRVLKDNNGSYLWQPSLVAGTPATLNGYAIYEDENMDPIAAGNFPLMFANLNRGYLIADRQGVTLLRDPYTNKPFVMFYMTARGGGVVRDPKAFVLLKVAA